jgi:hypothetical protein
VFDRAGWDRVAILRAGALNQAGLEQLGEADRPGVGVIFAALSVSDRVQRSGGASASAPSLQRCLAPSRLADLRCDNHITYQLVESARARLFA